LKKAESFFSEVQSLEGLKLGLVEYFLYEIPKKIVANSATEFEMTGGYLCATD
jgi:hypothetical protein